ncbi:helix-turn-helix transcriptional regulator [Streptomyces cyaneofuscatus]|uniref:helix-turn-helix domain-containing protein n=1 Tax=Streptomyces cyaneofuscatus TaxID=66883 RepID=UPI0033C7924B
MPLPTDEHIGTRVRIARNAAGLTQVDLGDFLGRTESWVANVESGRQPLDRYSVITAIADQCDVDVVWLLGQPYRLQRSGGNLAHAHIPALRTAMRRAGLICPATLG